MSMDGEDLRGAMRRWTTGVAILTSQLDGTRHGMTVNSFTSVSLFPPRVAVTLARRTRTFHIVEESGIFAVTILREDQVEAAERFAGRVPEDGDRFAGLAWAEAASGAPLLMGGLAFLDCKVVHRYDMAEATLLVGEVLQVQLGAEGRPLVYLDRKFHTVG